MSDARPPRLAAALLAALLPASLREAVLEETAAAYRRDLRERGRSFARRRFWREALSLAPVRLRWVHRRALTRMPRITPPRPGRAARPGGLDMLDTLVQDVRQSARGLAARPGFTLTAVLILAVGIGAAVTIYTVVDAVLLRPLPYPEPDRLVYFGDPPHTVPTFLAWRDSTSSFDEIGGAWAMGLDLTGAGSPTRLSALRVSDGFLGLFAARATHGRLIAEQEYRDEEAVALLGHGAWQRIWGADPDVVGRTVLLGGEPHVVVGILDAGFQPPERVARGGSGVDVWVPLAVDDPARQVLDHYNLHVVARLRSGVSLAQARSEVAALSERLAGEDPQRYRDADGRPRAFPVQPLIDATVGDVGATLWMLLGAVGLLLLLACANVANLLLARGADRAREVALRAALGAGRSRIVTWLLTESVLLALLAGLLGVGLAYGGVRLLSAFEPGDIPRAAGAHVDLRILAVATAVSALTGVLFGLAPALQSAGADRGGALREAATTVTSGRRRLRVRAALVVAEVAIALVLLTGAGLLLNSFAHLIGVRHGFDPDRLLVVRLGIDDVDEDERVAVAGAIRDRVRGLPGVEDAGIGVTAPFVMTGSSRCCWSPRVRVDDQAVPTSETPAAELPPVLYVTPVDERYFGTLGASLRRGRGIEAEDAAATAGVVLNASTARRLFGSDDALGHVIHLQDGSQPVVGVVDDVLHWGPGQPTDTDLYVPYAAFGHWFGSLRLVVRAERIDSALAADVRRAIWQVRPDMPLDQVATMRDLMADSVASPRFLSLLLSSFAALSLLLAAVGLYASLLYAVGQRSREIGVRIALGAPPPSVVGLVVRQGLGQVAVGVVIGVGAAALLSRFLEGLLFGIGATDPATFAGVAAVMLSVAAAACWLPARRAARTDPIATLRAD